MLLEPLVSTIETIKTRIATHGPTLRENETRTRMALIDPLLQALGWDTSDPLLVLPEFDVSGRKADYALLENGGNPAATLEAKKLGEPLSSHRMQMLNYSNASGVEYAGLTDGDKWELYEVFKRGQLEERRVLNVSIAEEPAHESALKLLLLWRTNLESGRRTTANMPVFVNPPPSEPPVVPNPPQPPPDLDSVGNWTPLSQIGKVTGKNPPIAVRFNGGPTREVGVWWKVLTSEVADWLVQRESLKASQLPIKGMAFVNSSPVGPTGKPFILQKEVSGGIYLNVKLGSDDIVKNSSRLLQQFGTSPSSVELLLE